jgi:hypothetical protein
MKSMLLGTAAIALMSVTGCTTYPAAVQTAMAQAVPPYHRDNDVDMDVAAGMAPVQSATHNWSVRVPFGN